MSIVEKPILVTKDLPIERRFYAAPQNAVEFEERTADGEAHIVGHPILWNSRSTDLGGFREEVAPSALDAWLAEDHDLLLLADHDHGKILARESNHSLSVSKDERGLRISAYPTLTSYGQDVLTNIKSGLVRGMSFSFIVRAGGEVWSERNGETLRMLTSITVYEVSTVSTPAYGQTDVSIARSRMADALRPLSPEELDLNMRRLALAQRELAMRMDPDWSRSTR